MTTHQMTELGMARRGLSIFQQIHNDPSKLAITFHLATFSALVGYGLILSSICGQHTITSIDTRYSKARTEPLVGLVGRVFFR